MKNRNSIALLSSKELNTISGGISKGAMIIADVAIFAATNLLIALGVRIINKIGEPKLHTE